MTVFGDKANNIWSFERSADWLTATGEHAQEFVLPFAFDRCDADNLASVHAQRRPPYALDTARVSDVDCIGDEHGRAVRCRPGHDFFVGSN